MSSVGEDFPKEQKRCRKLLKQYPAGAFGAAIKMALDRAEQAAISGDPVKILQSYQELKGLE